jgi:hypothetical protein
MTKFAASRSVFPSPLWGGVRGGGLDISARAELPPSPTLPHKGGGSKPRRAVRTEPIARMHEF